MNPVVIDGSSAPQSSRTPCPSKLHPSPRRHCPSASRRANPVTVLVEDEIGETTRHHLRVHTEGDWDFLVVPLHHIQRQLDDLFAPEVGVESLAERAVDVTGPGHQCIGEFDRDLLSSSEHCAGGVGGEFANEILVESVLPGNCRA